jgi:hypothetical protein
VEPPVPQHVVPQENGLPPIIIGVAVVARRRRLWYAVIVGPLLGRRRLGWIPRLLVDKDR